MTWPARAGPGFLVAPLGLPDERPQVGRVQDPLQDKRRAALAGGTHDPRRRAVNPVIRPLEPEDGSVDFAAVERGRLLADLGLRAGEELGAALVLTQDGHVGHRWVDTQVVARSR
jgi:hypothetical protein